MKMLRMFWKKFALLNMGLFIIIVRIYGYLFEKINKFNEDINKNNMIEIENKLNYLAKKNFYILNIIFIIISLITVYYVNKYFFNHKEYYGNKNKFFSNTNKNIDLKKYQIYYKNLQKLQEKNKINFNENNFKQVNEELKGIPLSSFTKEEQEYIEKLTSKK
jgi:hypothetical protein